jgi:serine/threonine protein kinase
VYKATWKPQNKEVALKIMEIENDVDANSVAEEIKLIKSCDSNHVVKYYGSYFKYDKLWVCIFMFTFDFRRIAELTNFSAVSPDLNRVLRRRFVP